MKAAREVRCRRLPVRWRRSCCAGERPLCCSPAASPSTSARCGGARAVSGQWPPRGRPAGQRRRGRRIGADVPTLTGPAFVLTSGAQVAPTCGAVAGGPRSASGARASAAVGAMSFLVLRSRSKRCRRLGAERPPVHATARSDPATLHPAHPSAKGGHHASRRTQTRRRRSHR